jgi:hypothetical protein
MTDEVDSASSATSERTRRGEIMSEAFR